MNDDTYKNISELFDLPGVGTHEEDEDEPQVGKDAQESQDFGSVAMIKGQYQKAIEHFQRAIEQGSKEAEFDLAAAMEVCDMIPQAMRQYEKAKKHAHSVDLGLAMSVLKKKEGGMKAALAELEKTLEGSPKNAYIHHRIADLLRSHGYKKASLEWAVQALALSPDEHFYHFWLADLSIDLGKGKEAVESIHAAIELAPADDHYYQIAGLALWMVGKKKEAIKSIRLATELDPERIIHLMVLQRFLQEGGDAEEAKQLQERLKDSDRFDWDMSEKILNRVGLK